MTDDQDNDGRRDDGRPRGHGSQRRSSGQRPSRPQSGARRDDDWGPQGSRGASASRGGASSRRSEHPRGGRGDGRGDERGQRGQGRAGDEGRRWERGDVDRRGSGQRRGGTSDDRGTRGEGFERRGPRGSGFEGRGSRIGAPDGRGSRGRDGAQEKGGDRRRSGGSPDRGVRTGGRPGRPGRDERGGGAQEHRGGPRLTPKSPRKPEPAIREGVTGQELDRGVKNQLRTLSKENAEGVAQHLVMVAELLDTDPEAALAHAETAVRRAGRVPAAREALGLVAYRMGDWARALGEFRTVRRLSGSSHLLPLMVDCERALGRHARALELAQTPEAQTLALDERVELAIVVSGIRRDLGQHEAAAAGLSDLVRRINPNRPAAARLYYAYADAKLAAGDADAARDWFARAAEVDHELTTDAAERLDELDGIDLTDLLEGEDDDLEASDATPLATPDDTPAGGTDGAFDQSGDDGGPVGRG